MYIQLLNIFISKGFIKHKQVKISDRKERCVRDIVTPFSSSNAILKDKPSEYSLKIKILLIIKYAISCK